MNIYREIEEYLILNYLLKKLTEIEVKEISNNFIHFFMLLDNIFWKVHITNSNFNLELIIELISKLKLLPIY